MTAESIGTCPICLTEITAASESFVEPCLHHFCFTCIQAWVKTQQNQSSAVTCPVCKCNFSSIIYDCHDVSYRIWRIDGSSTAAAAGDSQQFGLTPEQRRRRSRYLLTNTTSENKDAEFKEEEEEDTSLLGSFVSLSTLSRSVVAQWLQRELQALLLQEDVELLVQHILGNLKHEAALVENKRLKKPGRLESVKAVEITAAVMSPYLPEHAKRLGKEFISFVVSGLNIDAHDAIVFNITANDGSGEENEDEAELPLKYFHSSA